MKQDIWITPTKMAELLLKHKQVVSTKIIDHPNGRFIGGMNKHGIALSLRRIYSGQEHQLAKAGYCLAN